MLEAAKKLEFEKAARLRDDLSKVRAGGEIDLDDDRPSPRDKPGAPGSRAGRTGPRATRKGGVKRDRR
jgi:hypothetical protein